MNPIQALYSIETMSHEEVYNYCHYVNKEVAKNIVKYFDGKFQDIKMLSDEMIQLENSIQDKIKIMKESFE